MDPASSIIREKLSFRICIVRPAFIGGELWVVCSQGISALIDEHSFDLCPCTDESAKACKNAFVLQLLEGLLMRKSNLQLLPIRTYYLLIIHYSRAPASGTSLARSLTVSVSKCPPKYIVIRKALKGCGNPFSKNRIATKPIEMLQNQVHWKGLLQYLKKK